MPHPAVHLLAYLLVPVALNLLCAAHMESLLPQGGVLIVRGGGLLFAVAWGWAGLLICVLLGVAFGLPIAGLQGAYLRSRVARVERGEEVNRALKLDPWLAGPWPWFAAALVAYAVGWFWVFPPLGGPLMAVNVLWARTLIYRPELMVYEYLRADAEMHQQEENEAGDLVRLPESV